jgi:hypothetical protein
VTVEDALFGGPLGGGGSDDTSTGQQVVGIGLVTGVGYLAARRFTDFRLRSTLASVWQRLPVVGNRG